APLARTASTICCMPAERHTVPTPSPGAIAQPSRQHAHGSDVSALAALTFGSLYRSKITAGSALNVVATDDQNAGAWSASAMTSCRVAGTVPGAAQCRSRITNNPCWCSRATYWAIAVWYATPLYVACTPLMPSQQSSLSGTRTLFTCHAAMAAIDAASLGPSKMPWPWTQAYSVPE